MFVFDLGFGQRSLVVHAPQRRAQALVELFFFCQIRECVHDRGFKRRVDRAIGAIEMTEDAHPLTRIALAAEPKERALFALLA